MQSIENYLVVVPFETPLVYVNYYIFFLSFCASRMMSACVRPALREPSFLRYLEFASRRAADSFFLEERAFLETRFGFGASWSLSAKEEPSLSRSLVISRINAMYSSGVNIMSLAKVNHLQAESTSPCTKALKVSADARAR